MGEGRRSRVWRWKRRKIKGVREKKYLGIGKRDDSGSRINKRLKGGICGKIMMREVEK